MILSVVVGLGVGSKQKSNNPQYSILDSPISYVAINIINYQVLFG